MGASSLLLSCVGTCTPLPVSFPLSVVLLTLSVHVLLPLPTSFRLHSVFIPSSFRLHSVFIPTSPPPHSLSSLDSSRTCCTILHTLALTVDTATHATAHVLACAAPHRYFKGPELLVDMQSYDYSLDLWSFGCVVAAIVSCLVHPFCCCLASCLLVFLSSIPLCSLLLSCLLAISLLVACPLIHERSRSRLPSVGCLSLTHSPRPNTSCAQQIFKREPLFKGKDNNDQLVKIVEMLGKRKLVDYIKKYGLVLSKTLTSLISKYVFLFPAACPLWM